MKLSKIDLSSVVAIGHVDDKLGLLIDRGDQVEYIEVTAPIEAFQGLQQIDYICNTDLATLPADSKAIAMLPVNSSLAQAIGYDPDRKLLQVKFKRGSVYQYSDVDAETWDELCETDSLGRYYNTEIKGYYDCQRVQ